MDRKPHVTHDVAPPAATKAKADRRWRIALLLGAGAVLGTSALVAGLEPKIPPFVGD